LMTAARDAVLLFVQADRGGGLITDSKTGPLADAVCETSKRPRPRMVWELVECKVLPDTINHSSIIT
jgi:hypothetical protein